MLSVIENASEKMHLFVLYRRKQIKICDLFGMKENVSMVIHLFLFYPFNTKQHDDSESITDERCL